MLWVIGETYIDEGGSYHFFGDELRSLVTGVS
jgi:hypothetical protein